MRQTKERESNCRLAVDIEGLAAMLSCGTDDCKEDCGRCGSPDHHRPPGIVLGPEGGKISGSNSGIEEHRCAWVWFCAILFIDRTRPFPHNREVWKIEKGMVLWQEKTIEEENLRTGESQRKDGLYMYRYKDERTGRRLAVYSPDLAELRKKEKEIEKDQSEGILTDTQCKNMTLNDLF